MPTTVSLHAVADAVEILHDEIHHYLNLHTGEIVALSNEEIMAAENGDDLENYPDWQQVAIRLAGEILESSDYLELPGKYEVHEYDIMERFCYSVENDVLSDQLRNTIRGRGAFRRFKNAIHYHGLTEHWYAFLRSTIEKISIEWLEEYEIPFTQ